MKRFSFFPNLLLVGIFWLSASPPGRIPKAAPAPQAPFLTNVISVAASEYHTCAATAGGAVKCWGDNTYGQLGDGTHTDRKTPVYVKGLKNVTAVAAGRTFTCALTSGGGVKCWGANGEGQLGDGTGNGSSVPVDVSNLLSGVTAISTGGYHACARTSAGGLKCWGNNYDGQLGDGTTEDRWEPVTIYASSIASVSAGWAHTCAVTTTGWAKCWGNNVRGQLGDGTTDERHSPVNVSGMAGVTSSISAGGFHSCALTTTNQLKCWGWNYYGQLGDNTTAQRLTPVNVIWLGSLPSAVSAGGGNHTCALNGDGGVKCWGSNSRGQIGDNTTTNRKTPVSVSGLASGVDAVSAGSSITCARMTVGGVKCWGYNDDGQLGDGTTTERHTPVDVLAPRMTFRSTASRDGWVLESGESTSEGGTLNANGNLVVGDNAQDKQYRAFLYFNTANLPDDATLIKVTLKIKLIGVTGTDPFTTHGQLRADIRNGTFGAAALEIEDFQAVASQGHVGHFNASSGGWHRLILGAANYVHINLTGVTQFRLRFATGDNNDNGADYASFYSGEAANANRPQLIIEYVEP